MWGAGYDWEDMAIGGRPAQGNMLEQDTPCLHII